ncbi:MAG TPA: type I pantothenate kinase [Bryobacteraceae bacterium]|jgi:type I pantothenate kinase|nr:type I pantothenate kinase [Bryobacteraceae bacterium]
MNTLAPPAAISRYINYDREHWKALRANTPLLLSEAELAQLRGINEQVSLREVEEIYIPLSRLLNLHVAAIQHLYEARREFMGAPMPKQVPYIIGIAGSVAVGKSTFSRVLRACLARWPDHPRVDLITTDGFLHPNRVLEERGLMTRKGFPESYDQRRLLYFLADVKAGKRLVVAPVYSHLVYDVVPDGFQEVRQPDILIVEGLNVLQSPKARPNASHVFVSDFFDFSIYIDADADVIEQWYIGRFLRLRDTVFRDPASYFHRYASLSESEAIETARQIWRSINLVNLRENILPTRERAHLILEKGSKHLVDSVRLRRI